MSVVFVTAIYDINAKRNKEIWERYAALSKIIRTYIVCSSADEERIPENAIPIFKEFDSLETHKTLELFNKLPAQRNAEKDTKEYMILMNAKAECLQIVKNIVAADHYIWIDAGIGKIFKNPDESFNKINTLVQAKRLKSDSIFIPGCWNYKNSNMNDLTLKIFWRFAGGFFVVPYGLVDQFHTNVIQGCETIGYKTGIVTWEVNIWCFIESSVPIAWMYGDHNESIYSNIVNYYCTEEIVPAPAPHGSV